MDSPPSSSTLEQSLWYQPSPTQLSTLCEVAPMSSNSRDDAGVSEERVDTVVVPTKARKCNKCKKMKCRHSRASVSSSTKSKVSNPGGHRLDVSPATAVPLPSIEEGYNAPMTTIENNPPLDSSPSTILSTFRQPVADKGWQTAKISMRSLLGPPHWHRKMGLSQIQITSDTRSSMRLHRLHNTSSNC